MTRWNTALVFEAFGGTRRSVSHWHLQPSVNSSKIHAIWKDECCSSFFFFFFKGNRSEAANSSTVALCRWLCWMVAKLLICLFQTSQKLSIRYHTRDSTKSSACFYGLSGQIANWIQDFLTGRSQRVVVDGKFSNQALVLPGVPQGTVLIPIAFFSHQ